MYHSWCSHIEHYHPDLSLVAVLIHTHPSTNQTDLHTAQHSLPSSPCIPPSDPQALPPGLSTSQQLPPSSQLHPCISDGTGMWELQLCPESGRWNLCSSVWVHTHTVQLVCLWIHPGYSWMIERVWISIWWVVYGLESSVYWPGYWRLEWIMDYLILLATFMGFWIILWVRLTSPGIHLHPQFKNQLESWILSCLKSLGLDLEHSHTEQQPSCLDRSSSPTPSLEPWDAFSKFWTEIYVGVIWVWIGPISKSEIYLMVAMQAISLGSEVFARQGAICTHHPRTHTSYSASLSASTHTLVQVLISFSCLPLSFSSHNN